MTRKSLLPSLWGHHDDDLFGSMRREIDKVFEDFGRRPHLPEFVSKQGSALSPRIDVGESDTAMEVTVELPGVDEKDIDVTLADNVLTIKGEKKSESTDTEKDYHVVERSYGSFMRRMRVPFNVGADNVEAHFDKGVLTVRLPKPPEVGAQATKVAIKSQS